jgi:hypothetical protein
MIKLNTRARQQVVLLHISKAVELPGSHRLLRGVNQQPNLRRTK